MPRVLVIDDSRLVLAAMQHALERNGFEVAIGSNGIEGLAQLEGFSPDLVISDLEMPELDGLEVVRRVHARSPETPVLILTEHGEVPLVVQSMREGAFGYLRKGISEDALVAEINAALKHRSVLEQNRKLQEIARQYQTKLERMVEEKTAEVLSLQRRQAQTEKMAALGTLLAGVAHEVNNPLAVISGNIEWLQESVDEMMVKSDADALQGDFARFRVTLAEMATSSERIERLIARLRRLSHPGAEPGACEVAHALAQTEVFCRPHLSTTARLEVVVEGDLQRVSVRLPEDDLVSVLSNLVINACHAVKPGQGLIRLRVVRSGESLLFQVEDNGSGIAPQNLTQVFDPFFTTKAPGKGSGLGLSLVYQVVTSVGGEVQLRSQLGEGTTVELKLPVATAKDLESM